MILRSLFVILSIWGLVSGEAFGKAPQCNLILNTKLKKEQKVTLSHLGFDVKADYEFVEGRFSDGKVEQLLFQNGKYYRSFDSWKGKKIDLVRASGIGFHQNEGELHIEVLEKKQVIRTAAIGVYVIPYAGNNQRGLRRELGRTSIAKDLYPVVEKIFLKVYKNNLGAPFVFTSTSVKNIDIQNVNKEGSKKILKIEGLVFLLEKSSESKSWSYLEMGRGVGYSARTLAFGEGTKLSLRPGGKDWISPERVEQELSDYLKKFEAYENFRYSKIFLRVAGRNPVNQEESTQALAMGKNFFETPEQVYGEEKKKVFSSEKFKEFLLNSESVYLRSLQLAPIFKVKETPEYSQYLILYGERLVFIQIEKGVVQSIELLDVHKMGLQSNLREYESVLGTKIVFDGERWRALAKKEQELTRVLASEVIQKGPAYPVLLMYKKEIEDILRRADLEVTSLMGMEFVSLEDPRTKSNYLMASLAGRSYLLGESFESLGLEKKNGLNYADFFLDRSGGFGRDSSITLEIDGMGEVLLKHESQPKILLNEIGLRKGLHYHLRAARMQEPIVKAFLSTHAESLVKLLNEESQMLDLNFHKSLRPVYSLVKKDFYFQLELSAEKHFLFSLHNKNVEPFEKYEKGSFGDLIYLDRMLIHLEKQSVGFLEGTRREVGVISSVEFTSYAEGMLKNILGDSFTAEKLDGFVESLRFQGQEVDIVTKNRIPSEKEYEEIVGSLVQSGFTKQDLELLEKYLILVRPLNTH